MCFECVARIFVHEIAIAGLSLAIEEFGKLAFVLTVQIGELVKLRYKVILIGMSVYLGESFSLVQLGCLLSYS